jgi:hypothetical protein
MKLKDYTILKIKQKYLFVVDILRLGKSPLVWCFAMARVTGNYVIGTEMSNTNHTRLSLNFCKAPI